MSHQYCACYIPRPSHRPSFDKLSNIQMQDRSRDKLHGGSSAADCSYRNASNDTGCSNSWMSRDVSVTFVRESNFILSGKIIVFISLSLIPSCVVYPIRTLVSTLRFSDGYIVVVFSFWTSAFQRMNFRISSRHCTLVSTKIHRPEIFKAPNRK